MYVRGIGESNPAGRLISIVQVGLPRRASKQLQSCSSFADLWLLACHAL